MILMAINGLDSGEKHIYFGSETSVCPFCAEELMKKENIPRITAERKLQGELLYKKILRARVLNNYIEICHKHLEEFAKKTDSVEK